MAISNYVKFIPIPKEPGKVLIYSTLRGSKVKGSDSLVEAINKGELSEKDTATLAKLGVLVPDADAERKRMDCFFKEANQRSTRFSALVALNLDCNLACGYCFEDHFRGKKYMTEETADQLSSFLLNGPIAGGKDILLDFYGGEALLSLPLIKRIARSVQPETSDRGNKFNITLVTNGTLLSAETVEGLLPFGLQSVRTTIDGPPDIHDTQRPFVSGKGSFYAILKNLLLISGKVPIHLGGNYTRYNYHRFPELLDILLAEGLSPAQIPFVQFSPITPKAGEAGLGDFARGCACTSEPWLIEASMYLREETLKRGFNAPKMKIAGCVVEFENDLVVGYDGSLFKCPAFMGWPDMQIGSLSEGITVDYSVSHNLDVWKNDECLNCPYLPICFGGCRFLRRLRTGSVDGVDCRREYYDAALGNILLQDISYQK